MSTMVQTLFILTTPTILQINPEHTASIFWLMIPKGIGIIRAILDILFLFHTRSSHQTNRYGNSELKWSAN
jgi:hypothetical protein